MHQDGMGFVVVGSMIPRVVVPSRSQHTRKHIRCAASKRENVDESIHRPSEDAPPEMTRRWLGASTITATTAVLGGLGAELSCFTPASASQQAPDGRIRQARMIMRVMALRGSLPQQVLADFQTAMEGYGSIAMTQKVHLRDIWDELGNPISSKKVVTMDAVSMTDAWLQAAIKKGIVRPIPNATRHRFWVCELFAVSCPCICACHASDCNYY